MPFLHLLKTRLTLQTRLEETVFAQHLPASPRLVGQTLSEQVHAYAQEKRLGYYPALEFFLHGGEDIDIDPDLLDAARNLAWFAGNLIQEEVQRRLRGAFSHVALESIQCLAFTLPPVRMGRSDALERLAFHYTPDTFRLGLLTSSLFKEGQETDSVEELSRKKVLRHLRGVFSDLTVTSAQQVSG